jgi:hypothetical protein
MFIERSWARIRGVRVAFLLLGLVPCAGLGAWAAWRQSPPHREACAERFSRALGLPVRIGRLEHLRPGGLRARGVEIRLPGEEAPVVLPAVDVEWSAAELRLRIGTLDAGPAVVRGAAALARDWLAQPARFPLDCVVEVAECAWRGTPLAATPGAGGLRVECVAAHGSRAVRVLHAPSSQGGGDELRAVSTASAGDDRIDVTGRIAAPRPWPLVAAALGIDETAVPLGAEAGVSGEFAVTVAGGRIDGSARGLCVGIDAAAATAALADEVAGTATLDVAAAAFSGGRIERLEAVLSVSRGRVAQRLLDALVATLGCRPGPALRSLDRDRSRAFDEARMRVVIDGNGLDLRGATGRSGALVEVQGFSIIDEPGRLVPLDRLAWLMSPAAAPPVPASAATARLLDFLPLGSSPGGKPEAGGQPAERSDPAQAVRPRPRSGF